MLGGGGGGDVVTTNEVCPKQKWKGSSKITEMLLFDHSIVCVVG